MGEPCDAKNHSVLKPNSFIWATPSQPIHGVGAGRKRSGSNCCPYSFSATAGCPKASDSNCHPNTNPNSHSNPNRDSNANPNTDSDGDPYSNAKAYPHSNSYPNGEADSISNTCFNS